MKLIPHQLQATTGKPGSSTCFLVKIVCKDGDVFGFTSLDADVTLDDTFHVVTYSSEQELRPQNIQQELNYSVDNTDLVGWFDDAMEKKVLSGKFDFAEITIYRCAYLKLAAGVEVLSYGTVGAIDFSTGKDSKRKVEYRGLTQQLQTNINTPYSKTCRAAFGDERCGMPFLWEPGSVSSVGDNPYLQMTITGVAQPDGYFDLGIVEFLTGNNTGAQLEIESWLATGLIQLSFLPPYPIVVGDTLRIRRDCDKSEAMCKAYGNIINMRAEHLTPVEDQAIMVPGAYIKSSGAK